MKAFTGVKISGATPAVRGTLYYLIHTLLTLERVPYDAQLCIHVVSLQHMHCLNQRFRRVNRPTDVLTFAQTGATDRFVNDLLFGDADGGGDHHVNIGSSTEYGQSLPRLSCSTADVGQSPPHSMLRSALVELGDIFVCLEYMQKRCNASPSRCLPLVPYLEASMVHATLHALGYDHTSPQELQRMVRREQQLGRRLAALSRRCPGYLPPLDIWASD
ncbi:hypothetical protein ABL78_6060 [Leptomonas seymouri]|uniref:rRNA maturation factor n=1 Tax=Leptomonas seymouri TaxID=5684 RepID=A0A0N1I1C3_LEPSE|nr:hypothetical protein ABL78_6060 [Leptomonas seymouri]|eukprot:KPI84878.1 hypothetical protein ABL78_6060 [Leptomonas seymouri]